MSTHQDFERASFYRNICGREVRYGFKFGDVNSAEKVYYLYVKGCPHRFTINQNFWTNRINSYVNGKKDALTELTEKLERHLLLCEAKDE